MEDDKYGIPIPCNIPVLPTLHNSWWTDVLITINQEDYRRAKKHFHAKKVAYVPGVGIDTRKFQNGLCDRKQKRKVGMIMIG